MREKHLMVSLLMALFTFPGVVVHELSHSLFCGLFGVRVVKACYFRLGNPAGYVIYEQPENTYHHIWICVGPFLINTLVGLGVGFVSSNRLITLANVTTADCVLLWLGVSIAMHAFPSTGDATSIWRGLWTRGAPFFARLIGVPVVGLIYLGALGSVFRLDLVYGVAVVWWGPRLVMSLLS